MAIIVRNRTNVKKVFKSCESCVDFYINDSGKLVLVFDEYEVAPGYMGVVSFEIPTEVVADIVKEGYLAE